MTRALPLSRSATWSIAVVLSVGCAAGPDPDPGTGGSGQGASGGRSSAGGSGGAPSTGGSGGKATGSGGLPGTGGLSGTGGAGGTGGGAGTTAGNGGAGMSGAGGAAAGMTATGGSSGAGQAGAGGAAAGSGGVAGNGGRGGRAAGGAGAGNAGSGATAGMGGGEAETSAGCGKAPTISSGMYNNGSTIAITAQDRQRRYILNVPTNYDNTKPYKLIIAFHQLDGNDKQMYQNGYYHLLNLSNNSTIFVAPNGEKNNAPCTGTGNGESGCGWPDASGSNVALADAVVKQIKDNFCIDNKRIFATGWSYGGSMSYRTACSRALGSANGYIRGVAVYSGAQLSGNCTPSLPVAYFAAHGTHDSVLNYSQGVGLAKNFASANGCTWAEPTQVNSGAHVCTDEMGCDTGYPVKFCSFNGDHTPDPDNGQSGSSWVYQDVWNFFSQF